MRFLTLEPVIADIRVDGQEDFKVYALDLDKLRAEHTVKVHNGKFRIDGRKYQTIWY